jgi:hypothetical protein
MSGIKGKSGVKKGTREGNNPKGRPKGSRNKVQLSIKQKISEYVTENFDKYIKKLELLEEKDFVKSFTELSKLIVPRPLTESEEDANKTKSEVMKRLFFGGNATKID